MLKKISPVSKNKTGVVLLVLALMLGGLSAQATGLLNTASGGYLLCVNTKTTVVTHPGTSSCPKGSKKLVLGAQGSPGATGAPGSNATLTCAQGGTCVLGDTGPGGGKVFIVKTATAEAPWRYMEAAPNTWSGGSADPMVKWCSVTNAFVPNLLTGNTATVQTSTAIGAGFSNTQKMLRGCTFGAANAAAGYNGGGKSDWHLPSKDELNALYAQKMSVGGFVDDIYWSSSEGIATSAWFQLFFNGGQNFNAKFDVIYVRPVRAF